MTRIIQTLATRSFPRLIPAMLVAGALLVPARAAHAAAHTPEQTCQNGRYNAGAQYSACQQKALAKFFGGGDYNKFLAASGKCQTKYTAVWPKLQKKAPTSTCGTTRFTAGATTVTDKLTGLQWEKKTDVCPAGYDASGTFASSLGNTGTWTMTVDPGGTTWTAVLTGTLSGPGSCSGGVTGSTFTGTCTALSNTASLSGSFDCGSQTVTFSFSNVSPAVTGSGSGTMAGTDVHDIYKRYTWSATLPEADGTAFTTFLPALNSGGCFAGQCDWRLPTIYEWQTIMLSSDSCATTPCIDPVFDQTVAGFYWSATTFATNPGGAWQANFFYDGPFASKSNGLYVRAVRGGL